MITSWVAYGIMMVIGLSAIIVSVAGGDVAVFQVILILIIGVGGWLCMMGHAEVARNSDNDEVLPKSTTVTGSVPPTNAGAGSSIQQQAAAVPGLVSSGSSPTPIVHVLMEAAQLL